MIRNSIFCVVLPIGQLKRVHLSIKGTGEKRKTYVIQGHAFWLFARQHQNRWFLWIPLTKITYSFIIQAEHIFVYFLCKAKKSQPQFSNRFIAVKKAGHFSSWNSDDMFPYESNSFQILAVEVLGLRNRKGNVLHNVMYLKKFPCQWGQS